MKKPIYNYPEFVKKIRLKAAVGKRYWLKLIIDEDKTDQIAVILKNPSRADHRVSDKTVFNVANYIYRNRDQYVALKNIGKITIVNLIPDYLTDSHRLKEFKDHIINKENLRALRQVCCKNRKVIIAWGNHPTGLYEEFEMLKKFATDILSKNKNVVFFVDRMTKKGNPKHGQVWGYRDELIRFI